MAYFDVVRATVLYVCIHDFTMKYLKYWAELIWNIAG